MISAVSKLDARVSDARRAKSKTKRVAPSFKVEQGDNGAVDISPEHPNAAKATDMIMNAVGADDLEFYRGFLDDLARLATVEGELNEERLNFLASAVKGIEPRDQVEAMLAAQMAAVHSATLQAARRLHTAESLPVHDSMEKTLNKLARTFTSQLEALRKYRSGGEQRVTVQHVNVNEGGQAIVGAVSGGGGLTRQTEETS